MTAPNTNADAKQDRVPKLLRDWKTPWRATANGILAADGSWIMASPNASLAIQIVEMANYAVNVREESAKIADEWAVARPNPEVENHDFTYVANYVGEKIAAAIRREA